MDLNECLFTRRSIRAFTPDPISAEEMQKIIEAAAAAPTGSNAQEWRFVTVQDPAMITVLRSFCPGVVGMPTGVIAICIDHSQYKGKKPTEEKILYMDMGAAMQNILLAAHDLGFGGCPIGSYHPEAVRTLLKLPEEWELTLLVVLGKPKFQPKAPPHKPLEQIWFQGPLKPEAGKE